MENRKNKPDSALHVQKGIEQPPLINEAAVKKILVKKTKLPDVQTFYNEIISGNVSMLGKAITLIESTLPDHQKLAQKILELCLPHSGKSFRVGITGVPGVGKSSFIEAMGTYLTAQKHKLAVLAIDPSSSRTKGSILGDKTRMEELSSDANAFIRPSPSSGSLGGVARKTWESIILCEAAGYDIVFVETVGVGQSETLVHSMVDFFLLLMLAGAGDELQGIKRGIMEMADAIVINKADGSNIRKAEAARIEFANAVRLLPPPASHWNTAVMSCSSTEKSGIAEIWDMMTAYKNHVTASGYFAENRAEQSKFRLYQSLNNMLLNDFYQHPQIKKILTQIEKEVSANKISSYVGAQKIIELYYQYRGK